MPKPKGNCPCFLFLLLPDAVQSLVRPRTISICPPVLLSALPQQPNSSSRPPLAAAAALLVRMYSDRHSSLNIPRQPISREQQHQFSRTTTLLVWLPAFSRPT